MQTLKQALLWMTTKGRHNVMYKDVPPWDCITGKILRQYWILPQSQSCAEYDTTTERWKSRGTEGGMNMRYYDHGSVVHCNEGQDWRLTCLRYHLLGHIQAQFCSTRTYQGSMRDHGAQNIPNWMEKGQVTRPMLFHETLRSSLRLDWTNWDCIEIFYLNWLCVSDCAPSCSRGQMAESWNKKEDQNTIQWKMKKR